jgi:hypothetical protein
MKVASVDIGLVVSYLSGEGSWHVFSWREKAAS